MKKLIYVMMGIMCLFCLSACSSKEESITINTVGVIDFTDKIMECNGYDIQQRSVSQRMDSMDKFIVEYWWQKDGNKGHYGYYIQQVDKNYIVLEEGNNIDRNIFN